MKDIHGMTGDDGSILRLDTNNNFATDAFVVPGKNLLPLFGSFEDFMNAGPGTTLGSTPPLTAGGGSGGMLGDTGTTGPGGHETSGSVPDLSLPSMPAMKHPGMSIDWLMQQIQPAASNAGAGNAEILDPQSPGPSLAAMSGMLRQPLAPTGPGAMPTPQLPAMPVPQLNMGPMASMGSPDPTQHGGMIDPSVSNGNVR